MTPESVHYGLAQQIYQSRTTVLEAAYKAHPERFVRNIPRPPVLPQAAWINKPKTQKSSASDNFCESATQTVGGADPQPTALQDPSSDN